MMSGGRSVLIEPDRRTACRDGIKALRGHPVQDELTELVDLLIETSEGVRHVWALG
jgi:hypothetical protein